jgi:LAO/AO transport system kinase
MTPQDLLTSAMMGEWKALARLITLVENQCDGYADLLKSLEIKNNAVVLGITGPPGAGKSTLTDKLIQQLILTKKKVAVLCVDPSSPFSLGAILGDRVRMGQWHNNKQVYIRSLASRGTLGGIGPMAIEITDILKAVGFDFIIIETVGVGQSEVDIAGLADLTTVVLVPESGDDIQTMKSGLMEVADIFLINKSDRPEANRLKTSILTSMQVLPESQRKPIVETVATEGKGIDTWLSEINNFKTNTIAEKKVLLLADKAWQLMVKVKMKDIDKAELLLLLRENAGQKNLYVLIDQLLNK